MKLRNYIFLHGGPGFANYLKPFFQELTVDANLIFYDQLKGPAVRIDELIEQLDEIVNKLEGEKILVGHSWGATLAMAYTARFESKISSMVLMSSGLNFQHWKIDFDQHKKEQGLLEAPPEQIFLSKKERAEWSGFLDSLWDSFSDETFHSLYDGYITTHDLTVAFSKFRIPVLYIFGSEDHRFPVKIAQSVAITNQQIKSFEVKQAGHFPFLDLENRKLVMQKIKEFVCN